MNYYISCLGYYGSLVKNMPQESKGLHIRDIKEGAVATISLPSELPALAEELSYAAISILPPVAANKAISEEFSDEERAYIVSNALYEIYSSAEELEHDRQLISNTFLCVLGESQKLDLLGTVRFRLPKLYNRWKKISSVHADNYKSGENLMEILDFLSFYAEATISEKKYVKVLYSKGKYELEDEDGKIIDEMSADLPEFEGMADEDILLSRLINLSPKTIDISEVTSEPLLILLKKIFADRLLT